MGGSNFPWNVGEDDLLKMGGGDMAKSDDAWSSSEGGDWGTTGDINVEDELDRACVFDVRWRGADGVDTVDTVRCQSGLRPEGLFRRVGRTSSRSLYPFVRLRALYRSGEPRT